MKIYINNVCLFCTKILYLAFLLQELIDSMLTLDVKKRFTAAEALKHPWISVSVC